MSAPVAINASGTGVANEGGNTRSVVPCLRLNDALRLGLDAEVAAEHQRIQTFVRRYPSAKDCIRIPTAGAVVCAACGRVADLYICDPPETKRVAVRMSGSDFICNGRSAAGSSGDRDVADSNKDIEAVWCSDCFVGHYYRRTE